MTVDDCRYTLPQLERVREHYKITIGDATAYRGLADIVRTLKVIKDFTIVDTGKTVY